MLTIDWLQDERAHRSCPICRDDSEKLALARYRFFDKGPRVVLLCGSCGTRFLDPPTSPPFSPMDEEIIRLYLEQTAGLDVMIEPVFRAAAAGAESLLEVGCGFGLALDFAHRAMGWEVRGFEPGQVGESGAKVLSVPIERRLLDETRVGEFDLVLLSEVIEHLADPVALMRAARAQLTPRGYLALSTPFGEAIHSPIRSVWMPALSPNQHLVLFSPSSLRLALTEAGFSAIHIEQRASTLVAMAGNDAETIAKALQAPGFNPDVYLSYLSDRIKSTSSNAIARGFAYRHLKTCVNHARHRDAERSLRRLRWLYFRTCQLDVERPLRTAQIATEIPFGSKPFQTRVPYNLEGLFYFLGMLELNLRRSPRRAVDAFDAALVCARHFRMLSTDHPAPWNAVAHGLRTDGENGDLHRISVKHRLFALAHVQPHQAAQEALTHHRLDPSNDEHLTRESVSELFDRLIKMGALDASAEIAPALATPR